MTGFPDQLQVLAPGGISVHFEHLGQFLPEFKRGLASLPKVVPFLHHFLNPLPALLQFLSQFRLSLQFSDVTFCHLNEVADKIGRFFQLLANLMLNSIAN